MSLMTCMEITFGKMYMEPQAQGLTYFKSSVTFVFLGVYLLPSPDG